MKHVRVRITAQGREAEIHPMYDLWTNAPFIKRSSALQWNYTGEALGILHYAIGDADAFEKAIEDIPEVIAYDIVRASEDAFYAYIRDSTTEALDDLFGPITDGGIIVIPPIRYHEDGTVTFTLFGPDAEIQQTLERVRQRAQSDRDEGHKVELRVESTRSSRDATAQNLERMQSRLEQLQKRRDDLQQTLDGSDEPIQALEAELNEKLSARVEIEQEMNTARQRVEEIEQRLRSLEQQRSDCERRAGEIRERVSAEQMAVQETRVRRETVQEQLDEIEREAEPLLEGLPADATAEAWQSHVEQLARKVERLGPVNLAAIDEYEEQTRRKEYLDQQHEDVTQALETLENAIARIDRETRQRFRQTFDTVNQQLQALFPRLFGGGQAHLEMTGDDLLSTGVTIMARPPGKRVSNIHLLSGGEKALTAVALVFAFFELNPAPFCMLDEVDAPLDDANVARYCDLVREMSDRVQFIFITHNKQTMELSNQLTGVTMREAGVSRLVAVDVREAADLAEA
jgi:chromosome segregation protein